MDILVTILVIVLAALVGRATASGNGSGVYVNPPPTTPKKRIKAPAQRSRPAEVRANPGDRIPITFVCTQCGLKRMVIVECSETIDHGN